MATDSASTTVDVPPPPPPPPPPVESENQQSADMPSSRVPPGSASEPQGLETPGLEPTQDFQQGLDNFSETKAERQADIGNQESADLPSSRVPPPDAQTPDAQTGASDWPLEQAPSSGPDGPDNSSDRLTSDVPTSVGPDPTGEGRDETGQQPEGQAEEITARDPQADERGDQPGDTSEPLHEKDGDLRPDEVSSSAPDRAQDGVGDAPADDHSDPDAGQPASGDGDPDPAADDLGPEDGDDQAGGPDPDDAASPVDDADGRTGSGDEPVDNGDHPAGVLDDVEKLDSGDGTTPEKPSESSDGEPPDTEHQGPDQPATDADQVGTEDAVPGGDDPGTGDPDAQVGEVDAESPNTAKDRIADGQESTDKHFPTVGGPADGTLYRVDKSTGEVNHYADYDANGNITKRVDLVGPAHNGVETPHVHEYVHDVDPQGRVHPRQEKEARPADPKEIP